MTSSPPVQVTKVRKRDGTIQPFDREKLANAVRGLATAAKIKDGRFAEKVVKQVVDALAKHFSPPLIPTTADIHDIIEEVFTKAKHHEAIKASQAYREKVKVVREFRTFMGVRDDLKLSENAIRVLASRYLLQNEEGNIVETPSRLFRRVAKAISSAERHLPQKVNVQKVEDAYYHMLTSLDFLPNTPTLMNAGTGAGQLAACFVLPVEDSLKSIFSTLTTMALIHQTGGGTGFDFSSLRPTGDVIESTVGKTTGPLSFIELYDRTTEIMKKGGKRRGANMAVLSVSHPDVISFITAKANEQELPNFNISLTATDKFMDAVQQNKPWQLINPRTGRVVRTLPATEIFELATVMAWRSGDPGLVFIDEINRHNPIPKNGMTCTNPCGEQPLSANESCTLGSINLSRMVEKGKVQWEKLRRTVRLAVRFLDDVIDANKYPTPEIEQATKATRKIGLGVMGFADALIMLGIPYDSDKTVEFAEKLMKFINDEARNASVELGMHRGSFPLFGESVYAKKYKAMRNATVTTIAPTGTIGLIANASSGIEPLFSVSYIREALDGAHFLETNRHFVKIAKERKFFSKEIMARIARTGRARGMKGVPKDAQRLFVTAFEISPEWHVKIQAAFQKHVDNAVSKTINLPNTATISDVRKTYLLAHKMKCKGITVYRYGSKKSQVLNLREEEGGMFASKDFSGGCMGKECFF